MRRAHGSEPRRRGRLIVLEGGEGAGKSTHAPLIVRWLESRGRSVVATREPGGSPLAEEIRAVVLRRWDEGVDPVTELLLMFAARAAHLHATIRPALAAGRDVVCDRFLDATYAYQGTGRGLRERHIDALAEMVLGKLRPDVVLLLDVDPDTAARRVGARGGMNRFDEETREFQARVRRAYRRRAARDPRRYAVIDAARDVAAVQRDVERVLERLK